MRLSEHQQEFTRDIANLIDFAYCLGIGLTFGGAYRTIEQQKIYFESGESKTMNSNHLKRLAVDFNFFINGKLTYDKEKIKPLGDYWENLSTFNRWGGYFKSYKKGDTPHFERNIS